MAEPVAPAETAPAETAPAFRIEDDELVHLSTDTLPTARKDEPAKATESESDIPGWFRVDSDGLGLQLWFGATHDLGADVYLATDIYVDSDNLARFDVGIEIPIGNSLVIPMFGLGFDWSEYRLATLVPQLFAHIDGGPIYVEYWGLLFFNSPLASDDIIVAGDMTEEGAAADTFYNRLQFFFNVSDTVQVGPQVELTLALNGAAKGPDDDIITSLPIGIGSNVAYGKSNTLGLWLAYETDRDSQNLQIDMNNGDEIVRAITGRFTFIRVW